MRLIEIVIPEHAAGTIYKVLEHDKVIEQWTVKSTKGDSVIKALIHDENAKVLLGNLEKISAIKRVVLYPVEGTLPKLETDERKGNEKIKIGNFTSISKEELYSDIAMPINMSLNFLLMVILSSLVAGIGILKNNQAIIIGAMVIAPFLGPNMSMAFGTTLGEWPIIKKSIITGMTATFLALAISILWGLFSGNESEIPVGEMIEYRDVLLALLCGFAGVISVISGQGTTLVGVMVAVALLPPLMRSGLLLGTGEIVGSINSFLIFSTNIVCVNIAGIVSFYLAGIRPERWWEKENATKKTRIAFIFWTAALAILIIAISIARQVGERL